MTKQEIAAIHDEFFASLAFFQAQEMAQGREFYFSLNEKETYYEGFWFDGNNDFLDTFFGFELDMLTDFRYTDKIRIKFYFQTKELKLEIDYKTDKLIAETLNLVYNKTNNFSEKTILPDTNTTIHEKIKYFIETDLPTIENYIKENILNNKNGGYPMRIHFAGGSSAIRYEHYRKSNRYNKYINVIEKKAMPFALRYLEVSRFRGIEHLKLENLPLDAHWIFLTGENGFGKTSVLQAIAKGWISNDSDNIEEIILDKWANNETELGVLGVKRDGAKSLAAYGAARFSMQSNSSKNADEEKSDVLYSLFKDDGNLKNIEFELAKPSRRAQMRQILLAVIPQLEDILIDDDLNVTYIERDSRQPVTYFELAAGYRSIIAMIGDMVIRLSANKPQFKSTHDLEGLVIIDEIDAHLHPKYQKEFVELLTKHFPNIQFIASTHSPIPLLGAPKNSIILTVNRTKEDGITIDRVDDDLGIDFHKLQPNALFASPIFGFDDFYSNEISDISDVSTEDSAAEASRMERLKQQFLKLKNSEAKR